MCRMPWPAGHIDRYAIRHREAWQLLYKLSVYLSQRARFATALLILEKASEFLSQDPRPNSDENQTIDQYLELAAKARQAAD